MKLAGIAEDPEADGPVRTAIISGEGQLFMVKEGEAVTPRYRVAKISADVVELVDLSTTACEGSRSCDRLDRRLKSSVDCRIL